MIAQHRRTARRVAHTCHHTAQGVGEQEGGGKRRGPTQRAQQLAAQRVVVGVTRVGRGGASATVLVLMLLHPKGVHRDGGVRPIVGATQDPTPTAIVHVPLRLSARGAVPTHQQVLWVVGQRPCVARSTRCSARAQVAPAIVAGPITLHLAARVRTIRIGWIHRGQLMGLVRVAVQVLVRPFSIERTLPQLPQVRVDVAAGVGPSQALLQGSSATGAIACRGRGGAVAGIDQTVLLVVTEVLRLSATRPCLPWHHRLRHGLRQHIACRVVAHPLTENGPG